MRFIGTDESRERFRGKARIGVDRAQLQQAIVRGEKTSSLYFLFEHGTSLNQEGLAIAARAAVPAVVSINIFHYGLGDHMKLAKADVEWLRALGVTEFQIDSVYDRWLIP